MITKKNYYEWINNGAKVDQGLSLLKKVCNNSFYLGVMARKPEAMARKSIKAELWKYAVKAERSGAAKNKAPARRVSQNQRTDALQRVSQNKQGTDALQQVSENNHRTDALQRVSNKKPTQKLRNQFPFLNRKDCPNEIKILVSDLITTWERLNQIREEELPKAKNKNQRFALAKEAAESHRENRIIWREINYYNENGKILGEHPIFTEKIYLDKIAAMNFSNLEKEGQRVQKAIWDNKRRIKNNPESDANENRRNTINNYEWKLDQIQKEKQKRDLER